MRLKINLNTLKNTSKKKYRESSRISLSDKSDILDKVCSIAMADGKIQDLDGSKAVVDFDEHGKKKLISDFLTPC